MSTKSSTIFLVVAMILFANVVAIVGQQSPVDYDRQVKAKVNKFGAGAKVTVYLKDGTKVRGNIGQILEDTFDVTLNKETQSSIISYRDVQKVKRRGWSTTAKVGVGVAAGAGAVIGLLFVIISSSNSIPF